MIQRFKLISAFLLPLVVAGWLGSCHDRVPKSPEEVPDTPEVLVIEHGLEKAISSITVDSIQALTKVDPAVLPYNGRFFSSVAWHDQLGRNILILSKQEAYEDGHGRKEIFAYHYVQKDSVNDLLWQMNDFVEGLGCDLNIQLIHFFPLISDIDSNGIAETALFYSLDNRCDAVPFPAKLIVHEGKEKWAIRGIRNQFLGPPESVNNEYRAKEGLAPIRYKNVDPDSAGLDSSIVHFYVRQWDEFMATEHALEGALPDSLITIMN